MGGFRVVEAAGRGLAGLAGRLVTVGRPPRASRTARTATRSASRPTEGDRAGLPTYLRRHAARAMTAPRPGPVPTYLRRGDGGAVWRAVVD